MPYVPVFPVVVGYPARIIHDVVQRFRREPVMTNAGHTLRRDPRQLAFNLRRLVMKRGNLRANEIGKVLVP